MTPSSIDIRFNSPAMELIINADPTQMHQIIVNLVTNAAQSLGNKGDGIIEVAVDPMRFDESTSVQYPTLAPGEYARIMVADNGTGIPMADNISQIEPIENSEPVSGGNENILVIDDEPAITNMLKLYLKSIGYSVTTSNDNIEPLEVFRSSPDKYDLVITDMTMPRITGVELAQTIKMIRPETPVILCTGFSENVNVHNAAKLNIDAFLMKPVEIAKMIKTVRKVLDEVK